MAKAVETVRDVETPPAALVHCPRVKFNLRRLSKCNGCEFFMGLTEKLSRPGIAFHEQYLVICAHPMSRAISMEAE